MARASTKRQKRVNRKMGRLLFERLSNDQSHFQYVMDVSLVCWMAAQQQISPDYLPKADAIELFDSLLVLARQSRDVEGFGLSRDIGNTSLGRRWREIRLRALKKRLVHD